MVIKILGSGCKNCNRLEANAKKALIESNINAEVLKVTDIREIMKYGVMSTPALVINEKVVSQGKELLPKDISSLLGKHI